MSARLTDDFKDFISLLNQNEVDFAICGGHAVAFYGYPRMTMDIDILINPSTINAQKLMKTLEEFGFGGIPQLNAELFKKRGVVFNLGSQPNQIDLLTSMSSQDESDIFSHKVKSELDKLPVWFVSYEDLIRAKKESGRLKDLLDLEELSKIRE